MPLCRAALLATLVAATACAPTRALPQAGPGLRGDGSAAFRAPGISASVLDAETGPTSRGGVRLGRRRPPSSQPAEAQACSPAVLRASPFSSTRGSRPAPKAAPKA